MKAFRSWLFTPQGALVYFGVGYALIVLGVLLLAGCAHSGPNGLPDNGCPLILANCQ